MSSTTTSTALLCLPPFVLASTQTESISPSRKLEVEKRLGFIMSTNSRPTTARELSKQQIKEFKEAFDLFDLNKDNKISKDELGKVMESMGMNPTKQELKDMIDNADIDGSNYLEFNEFLNLMIKRVANDDDKTAELREAFKVFDKNGDNFISRSELKSALRKMGEEMSDKEVDKLILQVDLDRDGKVNYEEFVNVMHGH